MIGTTFNGFVAHPIGWRAGVVLKDLILKTCLVKAAR